MNKDQLIKALKEALQGALNRLALSGLTLDEETRDAWIDLVHVVPLTESEERIEAMREEILARSEAKAAPAVRRTGVPLIQSPRVERLKFYDNLEVCEPPPAPVIDVDQDKLGVTHEPRHPRQPERVDGQGIVRFKANAIVQHLLDHGGIDMNQLAMLNFSDEDRCQFAQLVGYSVSGYDDLSYVHRYEDGAEDDE